MKPGRAPSRPAVRRPAARPLPGAELAPEYEEAFREWEGSGEALAWDQATGDGIRSDTSG